MKKNFVLLFALGMLLASCGTMAVYDIGLSAVESPADAKIRYGETKIVEFTENSIQKYRYEDDYIDIVWLVSTTRLDFTLKNKSGHSIKINWDEVTYVDWKEQADRIMHKGIRYNEREKSQGFINIPNGTSLTDVIIPISKVKFDGGKWIELALIPCYYDNKRLMLADIQKGTWIGKTIKVLFPIEIEGVKNDYSFEFKVNKVLNQ